MGKTVSPLQVYRLLDRSNCGECGYESCLEFAKNLLDRKVQLEKCTHLSYPEQVENYYRLKELIQPPQWQITFGTGKRKCTIGGEEVFFRHQRTFFNQTALSVEVHDEMDNLENVVSYLDKLTITRIGEDLKLDAIAVRCVSGDYNTYRACIHKVTELTELPLILCCLDPDIMSGIAEEFKDLRPLLYAATPENAGRMGKIARDNELPLVCVVPRSADGGMNGSIGVPENEGDLNDGGDGVNIGNPGDAPDSFMDRLFSLVHSLKEFGVRDLVIDPGVYFEDGMIAETYNTVQHIRYQIFEQDCKTWGYPLMGVPAAIWGEKDFASYTPDNPEYYTVQYKEFLMATTLMSIDINLLILHSGRNPEDIWGLLGLMTYRQNIFTDPREYPRVDPGLTIVGNPDEWSPIFLTSNYRMTKIPVEQDLIDANIDGYLVVVDTDGIGIESATAGGQFNEEKIKATLEQTGVLERVKHKIVILPGMAARLQSPLKAISGLEVWVGPRDSSGIPKYMEKNWNLEEIKKKYTSS